MPIKSGRVCLSIKRPGSAVPLPCFLCAKEVPAVRVRVRLRVRLRLRVRVRVGVGLVVG